MHNLKDTSGGQNNSPIKNKTDEKSNPLDMSGDVRDYVYDFDQDDWDYDDEDEEWDDEDDDDEDDYDEDDDGDEDTDDENVFDIESEEDD